MVRPAAVTAVFISLAIASGIWTNARAGTLPDISGMWYANGNLAARCTIAQSGNTVHLTNEHGVTATGSFVDAGTIATNWGYLGGGSITGAISPDLQRITWSNGTYWSRPLAPIATPTAAPTPVSTPVPPPAPRLPSAANSQVVCKGAAPSGWVVTNDAWNPTRCGGPIGITYNVWTIVRLNSIPVGGTLSICRHYVHVPSNWVVVGTSWIPTRCGQPTQIVNNIATIKRVR